MPGMWFFNQVAIETRKYLMDGRWKEPVCAGIVYFPKLRDIDMDHMGKCLEYVTCATDKFAIESEEDDRKKLGKTELRNLISRAKGTFGDVCLLASDDEDGVAVWSGDENVVSDRGDVDVQRGDNLLTSDDEDDVAVRSGDENVVSDRVDVDVQRGDNLSSSDDEDDVAVRDYDRAESSDDYSRAESSDDENNVAVVSDDNRNEVDYNHSDHDFDDGDDGDADNDSEGEDENDYELKDVLCRVSHMSRFRRRKCLKRLKLLKRQYLKGAEMFDLLIERTSRGLSSA